MRNFYNYTNYPFTGGQNDTDEADQLLPTESKYLANAYLNKTGKLVKRSGATLVGNDIGATAIDGGAGWVQDSGAKWQFVITGGKLYYLNSTTWTSLDTGFTAGLPTEFVKANNKIYILNGTENIHSFDGASTTEDSSLTDLGNTIVPKAKYGVFWKNRMFVAGGAVYNGSSFPSRVYFSNLNDPDTYTGATDFFDVGKSDGQPITGLGIIDKFLVIFKRRSVYILSGGTPEEWILSSSVNNLVSIENSVGCVSHRSIVQVGDDLWFMSDDGIRSIKKTEQGSNPLTGIVSGNLDTTIASLNGGALDKTCAILFNKRVYYFFPTGSSTYNNLGVVADVRITLDKPNNPHPWVTYTGWNPSCIWTHTPTYQPQMYFGEGSADALVYQGEYGQSDNDVAIDMDVIGPMIDLQQPDMRKTTRFIIASGASAGDYDVSLYTSVDNNTYQSAGTLNLLAGEVWDTAVWDTAVWGYDAEVKKKIALGIASTQIQIRMRNNAANQPITLYPYTLAIKPKKVK